MKNQTDALIAASFKELAQRHPIEKITVKEITDRAGVIRPTFYNHFQDKYELLEWIINTEILEPVQPLIGVGMINEAFVLIFTRIEQDKEFYTRASRLEGQNSFQSIVEACVSKVLLGVMQDFSTKGKMSKYQWLTSERVAGYYAKSLCYVVISWIQTGMSISAKELAEIYQYIIKHSMQDIIEDAP